VDEIPAKGDNSDYLYTLRQLEPIAYYRLKIVDNDANYKYSAVIPAVLRDENMNSVLIYPNPAKDYINVKVAITGNIKIYDVSGILVKTATLRAGVNRTDISNLQAGTYYGVINGTKLGFVKQ
jgi:hypothetical protein